ncbi:hypothetical protein ABZS66_53685 [Dactylosporangium sp. NPDC005572]|uniref:hypothetical protein n=1 Tax=Dactylosporangium sp. NPDC005572 TaxID=3156889 RepID=UPI0033A22062
MVVGWVLIVIGIWAYVSGLIAATAITRTGDYHDEYGFQGVEEVAGLLMLEVTPACLALGLGIATRARALGRDARSRATAWILPSVLLAAPSFGWLPYWDDGGQSGFLPVPLALGVAGLAVGLLRRRLATRRGGSAERPGA